MSDRQGAAALKGLLGDDREPRYPESEHGVDLAERLALTQAALHGLAKAVQDEAAHWQHRTGQCPICDALATARAVLR